MESITVKLRQRTRGGVAAPMVLWALAMAVVLFLAEARIGPRSTVYWFGVAVTGALGVWLGWRRRVGAVIVAPLVSWLFAWFPLVVAAMIRDGVVSGLFVGLFMISLGWIVIGLAELVWLAMVAMIVRLVRGGFNPRQRDVVVFGPRDQ